MSRTVKAQREANQTNLQMTRETNQTNRDLAEAANELNYKMFNEQNTWNREQWDLENKYNSPAEQVKRYMEAGINPLWAISNGDPGNASSLTSAPAFAADRAEMKAPHVEPEYDPTALNNIVASLRDVSNTGLGFAQLGLDSFDADTRRMAQQSRSNLDLASAAFKRAAQTGQELSNQWNLETFGVRAQAEQQKLHNMKQQLDLMKSHGAAYEAMKANYDAQTDLAREKYNRIAEDYQIQWAQIHIAQRNARANEISANAQSSMASTAKERLGMETEYAKQTVQKWSNDQLLDFMKSFGTKFNGEVKVDSKGEAYIPGVGGISLGVGAKGGVERRMPANQALFEAAGLRALQWAADEPDNPQAVEAARIAVDHTNQIENDTHVPYRSDGPGSPGEVSIMNQIFHPFETMEMMQNSSWQ